MAVKKHAFNVLLDEPMYKALQDLSQKSGLSMGLIIRFGISSFHAMDIAKVPTCATGQRCCCPQMHNQAVPAPIQIDSAPPGQTNFATSGMPITPNVFPQAPTILATPQEPVPFEEELTVSP